MFTEAQETEINKIKQKNGKWKQNWRKKTNDQKKWRKENKKKLIKLCDVHPFVKEVLTIREQCDRPELEAD